MTELKPCPFCGSSDIKAPYDYFVYIVKCENCGAKLTGTYSKEGVEAKWNTRPTDPRTAEALEKLQLLKARAYSHADKSNDPKLMMDWIDRDVEFIRAVLQASANPQPPEDEE